MNFQVATPVKSLPAGVARERFFSSVDTFMGSQDATLCKSFPAGAARERFLSEVGAHMLSQMPVILKRFATSLAFKSASDTIDAQGTFSLVHIRTILAVSIVCYIQAISFHWRHRLQTS